MLEHTVACHVRHLQPIYFLHSLTKTSLLPQANYSDLNILTAELILGLTRAEVWKGTKSERKKFAQPWWKKWCRNLFFRKLACLNKPSGLVLLALAINQRMGSSPVLPLTQTRSRLWISASAPSTLGANNYRLSALNPFSRVTALTSWRETSL